MLGILVQRMSKKAKANALSELDVGEKFESFNVILLVSREYLDMCTYSVTEDCHACSSAVTIAVYRGILPNTLNL